MVFVVAEYVEVPDTAPPGPVSARADVPVTPSPDITAVIDVVLDTPTAAAAGVVDTTISSFVFEVTGASVKIDRFVELMGEIGLVEVARTGIVAMARGKLAV